MTFNYEENKEINRLENLQKLKNNYENYDNYYFKNIHNKKYFKVDKIRKRTIWTEFGLLTYFRRIYKNKKNNNIFCPTDQYIGIERYNRIINYIRNKIINNIGNGKRNKDILDLLPNVKISLMTISNIKSKNNINFINLNKITLKNNQLLYINIDDCFINNKYKIRPISFNTGKKLISKNRNKLLNKRISFEIKKMNEINKSYYLNRKLTINWIKSELNRFYENWENAQLVVAGDGANWITTIGKKLNAKQILSKFHVIQHVRNCFLLINNNNYRYIDYNSYQNFWKELNNFNLEKVILILENYKKKLKENKIYIGKIRKTQKFITYIKRNWEAFNNYAYNWNIGCSAESDVYHLVKQSVQGRNYNFNNLNNILIAKANLINSRI